MNKEILIAMSGGVDSAVAAYMLKKQGFEVTGVTMKLWNENKGESYACGSPADINDAAVTAKKLNIKHMVIDVSKDYADIVIDYFRNEYISGRTPNPCCVCNRMIKFELAEKAGNSFALFATGHYCKKEYDRQTGRYGIKKASDLKKDQSYFLSFLSQQQLAKTIFPLGESDKKHIKQMAKELGFEIHDKKESQDFKGGPAILSSIAEKKGNVVDAHGKKLGEHKGIHLYTIGQRKGLGISSKTPLYVIAINAVKNEIVLGEDHLLYSEKAAVSGLNLMSKNYKAGDEFNASVKIRANHPGSEALIQIMPENTAKIIFAQPQKSVTLGQTAAFYEEDLLLGGGIISSKE